MKISEAQFHLETHVVKWPLITMILHVNPLKCWQSMKPEVAWKFSSAIVLWVMSE